ncbi:MAG: GxxExxY protein [Fimbriimonas sp.]
MSLSPRTEWVGREVVAAIHTVHAALGPGLLESAYSACLYKELTMRGLVVRAEVPVPVFYADLRVEAGFRMDLLVNDRVLIEVKAVEAFRHIHQAQVLTYLRISGHRLGYLVNFNVIKIQNGVRRFVREDEADEDRNFKHAVLRPRSSEIEARTETL